MSEVKGNARPWLGIVLVALAALSWSTAGLFPRIVSTDVYTTLFWRSLLGGLTVLTFKALALRGRDLKSLWHLSWPEVQMSFYGTGAMVCFISAFFFAKVADVVFIYSAFPIITLLLSALLLGTRIQRMDIVCTIGVVLGMGLIVWGQTSLDNLVGAGLSLSATFLFALITIGIKRHPEAEMMKVTYAGAFIAAVVMLPFSSLQSTSTHDLLWLWFYGFLNVGVGFGLYLMGVRRIKAVLASLISMLEIPLAPMWVYVFFGEVVSRQSLIGGSVILVAVLANVLSPTRKT